MKRGLALLALVFLPWTTFARAQTDTEGEVEGAIEGEHEDAPETPEQVEIEHEDEPAEDDSRQPRLRAPEQGQTHPPPAIRAPDPPAEREEATREDIEDAEPARVEGGDGRTLDPLEDAHRYRVFINLRGELELVNVEGPGGFRNRDTLRVAPRRRAAYVDIDKITLDVFTRLWPWLLTRVEFRADTERARIDRAYVELTPWDEDLGRLRFQIGRERPMIRPPNRPTETMSPPHSVFWRGRSWHLGSDFRLNLGPVELRAVAAAAFTRQLGSEAMAEDPNLPTIAFDTYEPGEDATFEGQALIGVSAFGAHVEAFGAIGELLDSEDGPRSLNRTFDDYALLGDVDDRTSAFYGVRAFFDEYGIYAFGEVVFQNLGLLFRRAWEIGGSYTIRFDIDGHFFEIEPFVRYGSLVLTNLPEQFFVPQSWDREQIVIALLLRPLSQVEIKLEYIFLEERAGVSAEGLTGVADNQFLLQLRLTTDLGVLQ